MAEVAAHEYKPSRYNQDACDLCAYRRQHPVHAKWSRDYDVLVDCGPQIEICTHEEEAQCETCAPSTGFVTKDSGKRQEFASGMQRDTQDDKPRFDLLFPVGVPYADQFLTRVAELLMRGAVKYEERNWEKAEGEAELNRFRSSANRHMIQWLCGETDEDHMAAVVFNLMGAHLVEWKMNRDKSA